LGKVAGNAYSYVALPPFLGREDMGTTCDEDCYPGGTAQSLCSTDSISYAVPFYSGKKELTYIGIAKDGHHIYGPYRDNGSLWCDTDLCNGIFLDGGEYGYAATLYHPYFLSCFGPGGDYNFEQECSA